MQYLMFLIYEIEPLYMQASYLWMCTPILNTCNAQFWIVARFGYHIIPWVLSTDWNSSMLGFSTQLKIQWSRAVSLTPPTANSSSTKATLFQGQAHPPLCSITSSFCRSLCHILHAPQSPAFFLPCLSTTYRGTQGGYNVNTSKG